MGLPILPTYLVCVVGNMIPVPFIYLFARKFLIWGYHKPLIGPICKFCIVKGEKGGRALEARRAAALWWRCCCSWVSRCRHRRMDRHAGRLDPGYEVQGRGQGCMGGVLLAGIIMGLASAGLLGALSTLFSVG